MQRPYFALAGLLGFSLYTLYTMLTAQQSLLAFGQELMSRPDTAQVVIDLYLMALLACVWMYRDGRRGGAFGGRADPVFPADGGVRFGRAVALYRCDRFREAKTRLCRYGINKELYIPFKFFANGAF